MNNVKTTSSSTSQGSSSARKACRHCGKNNHTADNCFYKEATCHLCKKKGRLAKVCRQPRMASHFEPPVRRQDGRMQWVGERSPTPEEEYPLFCVAHNTIKPITVEISVVIMEVDTGAAVSLMSQATQEHVFPQATLQQCAINLRTYTGKPMKVLGELQALLYITGKPNSYHYTWCQYRVLPIGQRMVTAYKVRLETDNYCYTQSPSATSE